MLPSFATLPLLMAYAGHTTIVIPKPLVGYVGLEVLDLGTDCYSMLPCYTSMIVSLDEVV